MTEKVKDKVTKIIVDQLGVNEKEVTPKASFIEDLGADSLDIVELVMALEEGVESIDLNPVICSSKSCIVADARIMLNKDAD